MQQDPHGRDLSKWRHCRGLNNHQEYGPILTKEPEYLIPQIDLKIMLGMTLAYMYISCRSDSQVLGTHQKAPVSQGG